MLKLQNLTGQGKLKNRKKFLRKILLILMERILLKKKHINVI
jgi:hypothetical protein